MHNPFRYFNSSPEVIRLAVMMYVRYPLSLRQVEDLLCERGIDICHETVRYWWNRFGPLFAAEIRKRRVHHRFYSLWRWHLDEVFVRINGNHLWPGWRRALVIVKPDTVLRWHRRGFRCYWRWKSRPRGPGRPRIPRGIVRLIRLDPKNLQSRTIRLQVDATRPGRRLGLV